MIEIPEEWHVLNLCGTIFQIDADVRKEIESFLRNSPAPTDFIIVHSIAGEEITVIADAVNVMFSATPEQRSFQRRLNAMLDRETALG